MVMGQGAGTCEQRVAAVTRTPGCVAFWDFVKREPAGAHRFTAHVPRGATNDFPLDAGNYVKDYWGEGRAIRAQPISWFVLSFSSRGSLRQGRWFRVGLPPGMEFPAPLSKELMPVVQPDGVGAEPPTHPGHQMGQGCLHHQVEVVAHQAGAMNLPVGLLTRLRQGFKKIPAVNITCRQAGRSR